MDKDADFVEFVQARSSALLRTATLLTAGDRHAAEDLVQAALAKAYVAWWRIRRQGAQEAYVRTTMTRAAIDRTRGRARRPEVLVDELPETVHRTFSATDAVGDRQAVWQLLASLSPRQRTVLVLRYYEDLSEAEIARTLGCSQGSVKAHASRGIAALRAAISADDDVKEETRWTPSSRNA